MSGGIKAITLQVSITLLSDTIFGSGLSIPGKEEVSVLTDAAGAPFFRASTFRGLLRESVADLLVWTGQEASTLSALFGDPNHHKQNKKEEQGRRRIRVTDFYMQPNQYPPDRLTCLRTFTRMEDGRPADGSLRSVRCIRKGLVFTGRLTCAEQDRRLIEQALSALRFAGAMRHRGFGQIRCSSKIISPQKNTYAIPGEGVYIRYRFRLETPLRVTDGPAGGTRQFLEGSMLRGYVCGRLSREEPAFFEQYREKLLGQTLFLSALPVQDGQSGIPSIRGYQKNGTEMTHRFFLPDVLETYRPAVSGSVCRIEQDLCRYWSAETGNSRRISLQEDGTIVPFQSGFLAAGQEFEGYIYEPEQALREKIAACLTGTFWLGASQYAGFGLCRSVQVEYTAWPEYQDMDIAVNIQTAGQTNCLYLLLLSPLALRDETGSVCGLSPALLETLLDVKVTKLEGAAALTERGGYNRTWGCALPSLPMYDRGSIFQIQTETPPAFATLERLMREGIGLRRNEGFGQVLFLRSLPRTLRRQDVRGEKQAAETAERVTLRHAKINWLRGHRAVFDGIPSRQAEAFKTLLEGAAPEKRLREFLKKNRQERGAASGSRSERTTVMAFLEEYFSRALSETLGVPCQEQDKIPLLLSLLEYAHGSGQNI